MDQQNKKIIHVDMDCFFAQVEIRDNLSLKGKAVIISGLPDSRSVVCTCSYEARKFGIKSGMPAFKVPNLCKNAIYIAPQMKKYHKISQQIKQIFLQYTDLVEMVSLDEAYLDVTFNKKGISSATKIGKMIQFEIYNKLKLTCSIGISYNKLIAKIASDYYKPAGMTIVPPKVAIEFLEQLNINKFPGVGKKLNQEFNNYAIYKGKDFKQISLKKTRKYFGKNGEQLYYYVRGIDKRNIVAIRNIKSISCERTFRENIKNEVQMTIIITKLVEELANRLKKKEKSFKTLIIKVKYGDFTKISRSKTNNYPINSVVEINQFIQNTINYKILLNKSIRLLGLSATNLSDNINQINYPIYKQIYLKIPND